MYRKGWSYSPWAAVHLRPNATLLEVQARVGHSRLAQARTAIMEAIATLPNAPSEALRTVCAAAAGQTMVGISSQAGLAGTINHYDFLGAGLAGLDRLHASASQVTTDDVAGIVDRHLRADRVIGAVRSGV
jgi:predicted Zn-dependent peptidase